MGDATRKTDNEIRRNWFHFRNVLSLGKLLRAPIITRQIYLSQANLFVVAMLPTARPHQTTKTRRNTVLILLLL